MNNYLVIKDAVEQFEITQYALRKAIKNGQVRHFVTKLLPMNIPVMMVYAEDIKTYKLLSEGDFVPIGVISLKYNVHRSTMHYHKSKGAVRWHNAESKYMFTGRTAKISFPKKYIM